MVDRSWDVFICHAFEDKNVVARPLANALAESGVRVWLDEGEIKLGDSIRQKIEQGLSHSRFGAVVLSPSFFSKKWPASELDGLFSREDLATKVVLPVWHGLTVDEVRSWAPLLSGRLAVSTDDGIQTVARRILEAIDDAKVVHPGQPIFADRLNKKRLLLLPDGAVLLSNCAPAHIGRPLVVESLPPVAAREEVWQTIVRLGLSGTKFYAFVNLASYREHQANREIWKPRTSLLAKYGGSRGQRRMS